MNQKRNLILFGTVFVLAGTIYAFSGFNSVHSCRNLLSLGGECTMCDSEANCTSLDSNTFIYNSDSDNNYAMNNYYPISNAKDRDISFFRVPLVCSAAPSIGCGSRSKPVLASFEESSNVDEAWLNRAGTMIAIVWKKGTDSSVKNEITKKIFAKHHLTADELNSKEYNSVSESFGKGENWLKGSEVDKLSREEASIFAERLIQTIKDHTDISSSHLEKIEQRISDRFYDFFTDYESLNDLGDPKSYKSILKDVIAYGNELVGKDVMPSLDTLWSTCSNISRTSTRSCNHENCSSSCNAVKS
jgi:hypothetical protein